MFFENALYGYVYLIKENFRNKKIMGIYIIGDTILSLFFLKIIKVFFGSFDYFISDNCQLPTDDSVYNFKNMLYLAIYCIAYIIFNYIFTIFQNNETLKSLKKRNLLDFNKLKISKIFWRDILMMMLKYLFLIILFIVSELIENIIIKYIVNIFLSILFVYILISLSFYRAIYCFKKRESCFKESIKTIKNRFLIFLSIYATGFLVSGMMMFTFILIFISLNDFFSTSLLYFVSQTVFLGFVYFIKTTLYTMLPISIYYSIEKGERIGTLTETN